MSGQLPDRPQHVDRPQMPSGYGVKGTAEGRLIEWAALASSLKLARNYWIATCSPESIPHVAPIWGLWHENAFIFGTDPTSRKGRNIAANPVVVLHLESGDEVVIVEGTAVRMSDTQVASELNELYFEKYGYRLSGNPTYRLTPRKLLAWSEADFPESATRWRFPGLINPVECLPRRISAP